MLKASSTGVLEAAVAGTDYVAGSSISGTTNYIPKFTGSSAIGNSTIFDNSGNIGFGTITPETNLQIVGSSFSIIRATSTGANVAGIDFGNTSNSDEGRIRFTPSGSMAFFTGDAERVSISSTGQLNGTSAAFSGAGSFLGDVGIGTASPQRQVTINSSFPVLQFTNPTTGTTSGDGLLIYQSGLNGTISNQEAGYLSFETSNTEAGRISSARNWLIKTTTDNGTDALQVAGSGLFTGDLKASSNIYSGGSSSLVTSTGVLTESEVVQIFNGGSASTNIDKIADLLLVNNSSFTNGVIGRIVGINNNIGASEKRIAQISFNNDGATNSGNMVFSTLNAGTFGARLTISSTGAATFSSSVTATGFIVSSDYRYKNILSQDGDLYSYTLKADNTNQVHYGYIAQEVEKTLPSVVSTNEQGYKAVNYIEVHAIKIRELEKKIEQLEKLLNK
jgi:hypothetical protein